MTAVRRGHLSCSLIKYHIYNKSGRICVRRRTERWLHLLTDVCAGGLWSLQTALRLLNQKLLATVAIVIFYVCLCRGPRHPLQTGLRLSSGEQTRHDPGESLSFFFFFLEGRQQSRSMLGSASPRSPFGCEREGKFSAGGVSVKCPFTVTARQPAVEMSLFILNNCSFFFSLSKPDIKVSGLLSSPFSFSTLWRLRGEERDRAVTW